ncbi:MAG: component of SufBCD complex [Yoonia sp.]|uniref:component of SufBCD complex n=1 Tax=Yoonia sp. TaxID=2212373 RepID=UPI003EF586EF
MDWTDSILRVIELRTFSNIWFWLAVAVSWAVASHWFVGVPFDLLYRARKSGTQELADLEAIVDVNIRRFTAVTDLAGPYLVALLVFVLTMLGTAGFYYGLEIAQGLFILAAPLSIILWINVALAYQLRDAPLAGAALVKRLFRVRLFSQIIGAIALFFTSLYGMWYNLDALYAL